MAVNDLPSNVSYGTVVGRFLIAYADGADVDLYPDGVPAGGSIYFSPQVEKLKNATATPAPVTIIPQTIRCDLDDNGYITGPSGDAEVRLVATDDADNNPQDWEWKVEYRLTDPNGNPLRGIPSHYMNLASGSTVDLISVIPVAGLFS